MKKGDLFLDGVGTILQFEKYDEDGTPCFITNDNKMNYLLSSDGYITFSREHVDSDFEKMRIEAPPFVVPDYRAIRVNYINPTDSKPARVKLTDMQNGETAVILHEESFFVNDASLYLNKRGFRIVGRCLIDDGYILLTDNFDTYIV